MNCFLLRRLADCVHGRCDPLLPGVTGHGSRGEASAQGSIPRLHGSMLLFRRRRDHWIDFRADRRGSRVLEARPAMLLEARPTPQ